ncbi:hypothetical protein E4U17_000269 [Claviceps sp. LM77 group G4]|nr:hypothetical protein E4U17_000269 [Claviceps sp. LM77 group G4]KAG6053200.1 hypothetical protein E4U33_000281 [Claviceps sp. LM78 group G4]
MLLAQATRRFVVGFTICGTLMRVLVFDRLGGIASEQIDINKEPVQFIEVMLGFFRMSEEDLGFDPTIKITDGEPGIEIERNGRSECIVIDGLIIRMRCMVGRPTTCWKAHVKDLLETPLVIKNSWQPSERDEEREMLKQATSQNVVNVARYYHHEIVRLDGMIDDVPLQRSDNKRAAHAPDEYTHKHKATVRSNRLCPTPKQKDLLQVFENKCYRATNTNRSASACYHVGLRQGHNNAIYKASSRKALLACLEGCFKVQRPQISIRQRDISINNLMINEDPDNPSRKSFLIDLDFAINTEREKKPSVAQGKAGTRAFMAIGLLEGAEHTFMHDLESFFWVLFWLCIQYEGPGKAIEPTPYPSLNDLSDMTLACLKSGVISNCKFSEPEKLEFTPYYQPLIPHVCKLRKLVFPGGRARDKPFPQLYSKMIKVLHKAQKDPAVLAE